MGIKRIFKIFLTSLIVFINVHAQSSNKENEIPTYKIVFVKDILSQVNVNDASAALKVWVAELGKSVKTRFNVDAVIIDKIEDIQKMPDKENIALISSDVIDFLDNRGKLGLEGAFIPTINGNIFNEYILLAKPGCKNLESLRNTRLGIQSGQNNLLPNAWLDVYLTSNKYSKKESFFKIIKQINSDSQLVLSLFFEQIDACVVSKNTFELMSELNPQIKKKLVIVAKSPGMLSTVTSFIKDFKNQTHKKLIVEVSQKINSYPSGKQIMTLTNTQQIALFKEDYLNNVKTIINSFKRSGKSTGI
jgi:hypothetical protein